MCHGVKLWVNVKFVFGLVMFVLFKGESFEGLLHCLEFSFREFS